MSIEQVIDVARKDATAHGYQVRLYQPPKAEFESTDRDYTWVVNFGHKDTAHYLSVVIDERSGEKGFVDESGWHRYHP